MNIETMQKIISLTIREKSILESNPEIFGEVVEKLEEVYVEYMENLREKAYLQGRIASMIYDSYEEFMKVHENAVILSGMIADLEIQGKLIRNSIKGDIPHILEKYLMLKHH